MAGTGNLGSTISMGVQLAPLPITNEKFNTVLILVANNAYGVACSNGRSSRFDDDADVTADANLTANEKTVINSCLERLNRLTSGHDVVVGAVLTADAGSISTAMDAIRILDDDWHACTGASLSDANLRSLATWVETTDADEDGGKVGIYSHEAAGVGSGAYAGGTANISAAVATGAYERSMVLWDPSGSLGPNGELAAQFLGEFYGFDFDYVNPAGAFLNHAAGKGTFTTTQETNARTYTGTSVIGNVHGAGGASTGMVHPAIVGQGSAFETIVAADLMWENGTNAIATKIRNQSLRGRRAFPFTNAGAAGFCAVWNAEIDRLQKIGWIAPDVQPDEAGENGKISRCTYTKVEDLSNTDTTDLRLQFEVNIYTGPSARWFNGTIYAGQ